MTIDDTTVRAHIDNAAESIGRVWPLYNDVAANPLAGFEDKPFPEAVAAAEARFGGRGYPTPEQFRRAWADGDIDGDILKSTLAEHGVTASPETTLEWIADRETGDTDAAGADDHEALIDRLLAKWLAAFLDEGQAAWEMPNREQGFYRAWRELAAYDTQIPDQKRLTDLPETATQALSVALSHFEEERWEEIFEYHLTALPGWTGRIKQRLSAPNDEWAEQYPITLADYLAVRLILALHLDCRISPPEGWAQVEHPDEPPIEALWLRAWEETYRRDLVDGIESGIEARAEGAEADDGERPTAQMVFCIDTRSEIIRRHIEQQGDYETHGYAGFFGVPMEHVGYTDGVRTNSFPVIIDPVYRIEERPTEESRAATRSAWSKLNSLGSKVMKSLKNDVAAAFGFVEVGGGLFAPPMAARTLAPSGVFRLGRWVRNRVGRVAEFAEPTIDQQESEDVEESLPTGMTFEQQVIVAEAAFELMGWETFARTVVFAGHTSQTVNNPYKSSIDCGACAGSSGLPNARVLAAVCNKPDVREALRERGYDIPEDTAFVAAEHNTTTDEVTLFTDEALEAERGDELDEIRADLAAAREGATAERMRIMGGNEKESVAETERRAADWAEPRPEIGLSGNAAFVIGPRELTSEMNLGGRAFLHSYDYTNDPDGEALENIMSGPLVVTQMINAQYYFSATDTGAYSAGSKTTHNPVGKMGVYQGNGGDIMLGLPKQSIQADDGEFYHKPLRQTVVIQAPVEAVERIIRAEETLTRFFDNEWMSLTVIDPTRENQAFRYAGDLSWEPAVEHDVGATTASESETNEGETESGAESDSAPEADAERVPTE